MFPITLLFIYFLFDDLKKILNLGLRHHVNDTFHCNIVAMTIAFCTFEHRRPDPCPAQLRYSLFSSKIAFWGFAWHNEAKRPRAWMLQDSFFILHFSRSIHLSQTRGINIIWLLLALEFISLAWVQDSYIHHLLDALVLKGHLKLNIKTELISNLYSPLWILFPPVCSLISANNILQHCSGPTPRNYTQFLFFLLPLVQFPSKSYGHYL